MNEYSAYSSLQADSKVVWPTCWRPPVADRLPFRGSEWTLAYGSYHRW